jgi:predicted GNAT family acetyltransferase
MKIWAGNEGLLRLAEAPNAYEILGNDEYLIEREGYLLFLGRGTDPRFNTVQHLRLSPETISTTVAEVRAIAREHGRSALMWEVTSTATPQTLADDLQQFSMTLHEPPMAVIMALHTPPPPPTSGVTVSRVETIDDFCIFVSITYEVFGIEDQLGDELIRIRREGAQDLAQTHFLRYLAWIDGVPVAAASATFTNVGVLLHAGSTKRTARGRGAYRALVAARWDDALQRGTPMLVTRAGPQSRPILQRMGFEELAEIHFLVDRFGAP